MTKTLPAQINTESAKQGYKPRIGIWIAYWQAALAADESFTAQIESGADGATTTGTGNFQSTSALFETNIVGVGDTLLITTGGPVTGFYTITAVTDETHIIVTPSFAASSSGLDYEITKTYDGKIADSLAIDLNSNRLQGLADVSTVSFSVANAGKWSDIFDGALTPENSLVHIHLYFDDGTTILHTESLLIYLGVIESFPPINYQSVQFSLTSKNVFLLEGKMIGNLVQESDLQSTEGEPSVGATKPIIFGDHRYNFCNDLESLITFDRRHSATPCVYLGTNAAASQHYWLVSDHKMDSIANNNQEIWAWDSSLERLVELSAYSVVQNTAAGCIIRVSDNAFYYDYWLAESSSTPIVVPGGGAASVADEENASDRDNTTKSVLSVTDAAGAGVPSASFNAIFPDYKNSGTLGSPVIYAKSYFNDGGAGARTYTINGIDATGETTDPPTVYTAYGTDAATEVGVATNVPIVLTGEANTGTDTHKGEVYMIYKRVPYTTIDARLPLFVAAKGYEYDSWIDSRPNHPDNNSNDVIENVHGVIEACLRDTNFGLSQVTADIDTASYDAAATARSTWKFNFALTDQMKAKDFFDSINFEAGSIMRWNENNKIKALAYDSSPNFTISGTGLPDIEEIYTLSPTTSSGSLTNNSINKGSFSLKRMNEELATELILNYARNRTTDKFKNQTSDTNNVAIFGDINLEIDSEFIEDTTTAVALRDQILDIVSNKKFQATFRTTLKGIRLEIWDVINIQHPLLWDGSSGILGSQVTMVATKWLVTQLKPDYNNMSITVVAFEL